VYAVVASARAVTSRAAEVVYAVVASARAVMSLAAEVVHAVVRSLASIVVRQRCGRQRPELAGTQFP
jgi:hypothetical protein